MRTNFCCIQWKALSPDIISAKVAELDKVQPEYLVRPVKEMLNKINYFCPVCGEVLDEENAVPPRREKTKEVKAPLPTGEKCKMCNGQGFTSVGENGVQNACMKCLGEGFVRNGQ